MATNSEPAAHRHDTEESTARKLLREQEASSVATPSRRLAYADPPYPGQSKRLYGSHPDFKGEVDHVQLLERLQRYDGWALSTSNRSLQMLLGICPSHVRVAAWCNPNSQPFSVRTVTHSWEPVVYLPARTKVERAHVRDYLVVSNADGFVGRDKEHKIIGQKPRAFLRWVFDLLGAEPEDQLDDLFPGSGAVGREWLAWCAQLRIAV